jgi:hypothetical protein
VFGGAGGRLLEYRQGNTHGQAQRRLVVGGQCVEELGQTLVLDLGHLGFHFGPADQRPAVIGMDIAHCKDGVIVELYTLVTETR